MDSSTQTLDVPDVAVIVTTYQRPENLKRVLLSIALQDGVSESFEVIVADDGSQDATAAVVARFAEEVDFPVRFTTHSHECFHPARCRNEGVAASTAPYLFFVDGDCILPRGYLREHLARRRPSVVFSGDAVRLSREESAGVTVDRIRTGDVAPLAPRHELRRLRWAHFKATFYTLIRHPLKPRLYAGGLSLWRDDFLRVNGFDEQFRGWGCEDDDFGHRLRQAGRRVKCMSAWTYTLHLWHEPASSAPGKWRNGANVAYLLRKEKPARCANGLYKDVRCV